MQDNKTKQTNGNQLGRLEFSTGFGQKCIEWQQHSVSSWSEFGEKYLTEHRLAGKHEHSVMPGTLTGKRRLGTSVTARTMICIDIDNADKLDYCWRAKANELLERTAYCIVSSHSAREANPKGRIWILIDKTDDFWLVEEATRSLAVAIGLAAVDPASFNKNQFYYLPTKNENTLCFREFYDGPPLNLDEWLASYPVPDLFRPTMHLCGGKVMDPGSEQGVRGAFNAVYDAERALSEIEGLNGLYEYRGFDRYWWTASSDKTPGLKINPDGTCTSFHTNSDPFAQDGSGTGTAFDLVRVHMFDGDFARTCDWVQAELPEVVEELQDREREVAEGDFLNDDYDEDFEPEKKYFEFPDTTFPLEALPGSLGKLAGEMARSHQTDAAMPGILMLGVLGAISQRHYFIKHLNGAKEELCLYACAVADTTEKKSPTLGEIMKPFYEYEDSKNSNHAETVKAHTVDLTLAETAVSRAKQNKADEEILRTALEHQENVRNAKPKRFRIACNDTTVEALIEAMGENDERMIFAYDEGSKFFSSLDDPYNKGKDDRPFYLQANSGSKYQSFRKSTPGITLDRPTLTVMITVQPKVLNDTIKNNWNNEGGMNGRFLSVLSRPMAGHRKSVVAPIDEEVLEAYREDVRKCLELAGSPYCPPDTVYPSEPQQGEYSGSVSLTSDAREKAAEYFDLVEPRLLGIPSRAKGCYGRVYGHMLRIAGGIHVFECLRRGVDPKTQGVPVEAVENAIEIMEFLVSHARKIYKLDKPTGGESRLLASVRSVLNDGETPDFIWKEYLVERVPGVNNFTDIMRNFPDWVYFPNGKANGKTTRGFKRQH